MFIEVTDLTGDKVVINSTIISKFENDRLGTRIYFKPPLTLIVIEDYDDIKTMLNAKWVAE